MQDGKAIRLFGVLQDITERKRYEQTLWETNERFIAAFEHAPIGVALVMPDGRFIKVNRAICELVGYDRAELLSLAFQDITHPDDLESDLQNTRRVLGGEISKYEMEKKYVHKHGHFITVLLSVSLVRGDQGQPCYFIKQIQDITARKVAESALKDSEERLREAQTIAQIGSFHWNARTDHVWWSDETYRIYGHTSAGFVPTFSSYIAAIHPDDRLQVEESLHHVIAAKGEVDREYQILWPDGSTRSVHAKARAIVDRNGDFCGLEGTCQDITERKRTQAALEQSEARLRIVTGCARVGLVVADTERRYVFANAAYSSITDLPDHQTLLGRHLADVLPDVYEERIKPRLDRAFAGERIDYEAQFPTAKGIVHCVVNYEPVFAGDHVSNVVAVVMDITAQRNTEEQLRQSQKMETVGQLAGGIAHDFNNLLTIIGGYTDLLLNMHSKTDPAWDSLNEIRMASNRASDLTQRLMAFGRRKMRSPESMDLNATILDTQTLLQRSVGDGVQIVYSLSEDLKQIWMDRSELTQVLLNLAINARDAMQNTGRLEIQTQKVEIRPDDDRQHAAVKPGKYVLLRVSDSGCGMSAAVQARIFEPFFTTKPVGKGTGLGLATVHGIVGGCGGGIHVSSEVNHGTTFEVYLPQASTSDALPEKNYASKIPRGGDETILLVEDEHSVRRLSHDILAEYGYEVIEAENGQEAIEIFGKRQNAIHMLVTDVIMPGSDGVHLAEQILKLKPGLPVLFMSGYIGESKVWDCLTEMEFLQKPFVPIELALKVRQLLDTS
jgi:two-component system cell cycle sensor histidine kinase/response regulator CckA